METALRSGGVRQQEGERERYIYIYIERERDATHPRANKRVFVTGILFQTPRWCPQASGIRGLVSGPPLFLCGDTLARAAVLRSECACASVGPYTSPKTSKATTRTNVYTLRRICTHDRYCFTAILLLSWGINCYGVGYVSSIPARADLTAAVLSDTEKNEKDEKEKQSIPRLLFYYKKIPGHKLLAVL